MNSYRVGDRDLRLIDGQGLEERRILSRQVLVNLGMAENEKTRP